MRAVAGLEDIRRAIEDGAMTPDQAIDQSWERARELEPALQAFAFLPDTPPATGHGPLAGIAVGIKDLIDTADMPTAYGAAVFRGNRPSTDAAIVRNLRACGATILGKTVTTEFAHQQPGPTRNPWNREHTPGGSSSGSAAAVAAGIVPLAFGTQTMGSVIRPAAFCGIVGFKPTFGTIPRDGVHPLCSALDHVGAFARSVGDIDVALRALNCLPTTVPEPRSSLRLAVLPPVDDTIEPAQRLAFDAALERLRQAGHELRTLESPAGFEDVPNIIETLLSFEAVKHFAPLVELHGDAISAPIRGLVQRGRDVSVEAYEATLRQQTALRAAYAETAKGFDAVLTIPAAGEAPHGLSWTGDPRFCAPWSVAGVPALTFPIGFGPAGLPLGLQLVGHWGQDADLLGIGAQLASLFPPIAPPKL